MITKFGAKSETVLAKGCISRFKVLAGWFSLTVIDCLSAGYRFLGWRIELLVIPLLLDFVLWLGPRFGVAPIFDGLAAIYSTTAGLEDVTPDMAMMLDEFAASVREMGQYTNLADALVSGALFHVPSLGPVGTSPTAAVITIDNPLLALLLWVTFGLVGILLGVVYLGLLARRLPIGGMAHVDLGGFLAASLWHWLRAIGFILLVLVLLMMVYIPLAFGISIVMLFSPAAGSAAAAGAGGLVLVFFFYLYFAIAAIVMDNLGVWPAVVRSISLVRANFWATLGFILVSGLIGLGISVLLAQAAQSNVWLHVAAIVVNAYIGTGLALAFLVFYRSRLLKEQEAV